MNNFWIFYHFTLHFTTKAHTWIIFESSYMGQPLDVLWRHSQHFHGPIHHSRVKETPTQEMWNLISETLDLVLGWDIYHGLNQRQKDSRFLSWYKCECRFTQGETQGIGVPHCQHFVKFKNHTQVTDTMLWKELCVLQPCAQITASTYY